RKQAKKSGITESYRELYNLVRLKYGGTQPQNISKLNTENGGISKLLNCTPPSLADLNVRLPKADFFSECLNMRALKAQFDSFNKLMNISGDSKIPLEKQRKWRDRVLAEIIDAIIERLFLVREALPEIPANLKPAQKIWLNRAEEERRDSADWQQEIAQEITEWIIKSYRRLYKNSSVVLGDTEFMAIENTVNSFEELWK
ncbi:MAG TPA: hypothetical protein DCR21_01775, partial [Succinivibrionaceae bacterium]|nr:hypothetical protein [Succinivibrionaceae bacterium]